jgi:chorismate lyase/3-hydroxybenzoate synthase
MMARKVAALDVAYVASGPAELLERVGVLAVFDFGGDAPLAVDPRHVRIPLAGLGATVPHECWSVAAAVDSGHDGALRWSAGGGWRLTVVEVAEPAQGGIEAASEAIYRSLLAHIGSAPEHHLHRIWNYLDAINEGAADQERYRLFCNGRARALLAHGVNDYPAATAIGHRGPHGLLQVYALSAIRPGHALENPRQVSAWQYPRRYGPTAPSFARAMRLPDGSLAISGTAAVVGHASHHHDDVAAQADEVFANLRSLLDGARLPPFDARSPLKVYVRHAEDAGVVHAALARHLDPAVPRILLHGDICRSELLVEIDGWRFAS